MDALRARLSADARVQFRPNLTVTDEALATAVITLADSIARGDAAKFKNVASPAAQKVQAALESSGAWEAASKSVEAVRVVYVGPMPENAMNAGEMNAALDAVRSGPQALVDDLMRALSRGMSPEQRAAFITDMERRAKLEVERLTAQGRTKEIDAYANAISVLASLRGTQAQGVFKAGTHRNAIVLVVQEPGAAYLMGFGGMRDNDKWRFDPVATLSETRFRAAEFDPIGEAAFSLGVEAKLPPALAGAAEEALKAVKEGGGDKGATPAPGGGGKPTPAGG